MRKTYVFSITLSLLIALGVGAFVMTRPADTSPLFTAATPPEAIVIGQRDVVDISFGKKGEVSYSYREKEVPSHIVPDEIPQLRTDTSYTVYKGVEGEGKDQQYKLELIAYAKPTFSKDDTGTWRFVEYATTTEDIWKQRPVSYLQKFKEFFIATAHAVDVYAGAGDGYIESSCSDCNWADVYLDTGPLVSLVDYTTGSLVVRSLTSRTTDPELGPIFDYALDRGYLPFDTSSIPANGIVTSAVVNVYVAAKVNTGNDGNDFVTTVQTSQATHTSLVSTDIDNVGATEGNDTGERKDITSVSTAAYLTFTLNSTGRSWVAKSGQGSNCSGTAGITCIGLLEGHDFLETRIVRTTNGTSQNYLTISTSEVSGTTQDPYLTVNYSIPTALITIGSSGTLNVGAGGTVRY